MMKFKNFCGIFATVFVTTTIILLASCSQDDDYYESDMYTLAEMGTRSGGGDPGGQPEPVVTILTEYPVTHYYELCFFPNSVFNLSSFQHSPFVAIDPSLYGTSYIEVDATVELQKVDGTPTVTSYTCSPALFVYYPSMGNIPDTLAVPESSTLSSTDFEVTNVYLQPDGSAMPDRYILYATGNYYGEYGEIIPCTAFVPYHIYR